MTKMNLSSINIKNHSENSTKKGDQSKIKKAFTSEIFYDKLVISYLEYMGYESIAHDFFKEREYQAELGNKKGNTAEEQKNVSFGDVRSHFEVISSKEQGGVEASERIVQNPKLQIKNAIIEGKKIQNLFDSRFNQDWKNNTKLVPFIMNNQDIKKYMQRLEIIELIAENKWDEAFVELERIERSRQENEIFDEELKDRARGVHVVDYRDSLPEKLQNAHNHGASGSNLKTHVAQDTTDIDKSPDDSQFFYKDILKCIIFKEHVHIEKERKITAEIINQLINKECQKRCVLLEAVSRVGITELNEIMKIKRE